MAEISNSATERIAAMAIAYEIASRVTEKNSSGLKPDDYVKQFIERYEKVLLAVHGAEKAKKID